MIAKAGDLPEGMTNRCPECGSAFVCGMEAGAAECWCAKLPPLLPVPALGAKAVDASGAKVCCLCPVCLERKLEPADLR